jgi:hypothetical protein
VAQRALAFAHDLDYERGIAWGLLNIGYLKDFQGRKAEAISDLSNALQRMLALDDPEGLGYA